MREVERATSTNGRWGVSIVAEVSDDFRAQWPVRGTIEPLGEVEGHQVFRLTPDEQAPTWVLVGGELDAIEGASVVCSRGLQSNQQVTILLLGAVAVVRSIGYKGRSSRITLYAAGEAQECPAPVLLALGLLPAQEVAPVVPPPPPSSAFADALRRAGVV